MTIKDAAQWILARHKGQSSEQGIVGRCLVYTSPLGVEMQTTEVVDFKVDQSMDAFVYTKSGSIYRLGTPRFGWAIMNLNLTKQLGY